MEEALRVRYGRELLKKKDSTETSALKNLFGKKEIIIGVCICKK